VCSGCSGSMASATTSVDSGSAGASSAGASAACALRPRRARGAGCSGSSVCFGSATFTPGSVPSAGASSRGSTTSSTTRCSTGTSGSVTSSAASSSNIPYLMFAQRNGHVRGGGERRQRGEQPAGEAMGLVEDDAGDLPIGSQPDVASNAKDLADQPLDPIASDAGHLVKEPALGPGEHVV